MGVGQPQPKKRVGLIVGIIAAVVLLIGLGIGGALFLTKDDKDKGGGKKDKQHSQEAKAGTPAALMAKIRAASICNIHDEAALKKYAPTVAWAVKEDDFFSCTAIVGTPAQNAGGNPDDVKFQSGTDRYIFQLTVGKPFDEDDRAGGTAEDAGGRQVFRSSLSKDLTVPSDVCYYDLPFENLPYSARIRARKMIVDGTGQVNWAERCQVAKDYLGTIAPKIAELRKRDKPPAEPTLYGKDPCAKRDELIAALGLSGWKPGETQYDNPYECKIPFTKDGDPAIQTFSVAWDIDTLPTTTATFGGLHSEAMQLGGLQGVRSTAESSGQDIFTGQPYKLGGHCEDALELKPGEQGVENSAYLIRVKLETKKAPKPPTQPGQPAQPGGQQQADNIPAPSCGPVDKTAEKVVAGVR